LVYLNYKLNEINLSFRWEVPQKKKKGEGGRARVEVGSVTGDSGPARAKVGSVTGDGGSARAEVGSMTDLDKNTWRVTPVTEPEKDLEVKENS
jgi:hypothetical protein